MTKDFDNYIKSIILEMRFTDIPDVAPYGFWLSPDLELKVVKFQGHVAVATELVYNNKKLKNKYKSCQNGECEFDFLTPMEFLLQIGYIRIVIDGNHIRDRKLYYLGEKPNGKQKTMLKDLALFYGIELVRDTSEEDIRKQIAINFA